MAQRVWRHELIKPHKKCLFVLVPVGHHHHLHKRPIAALTPFDTEDEVVARANETEFGLIAYVHTQDPKRIYRISRALEFGMVAINRTSVTGPPIPFGGVKQSGLGREGARQGLEEFTEIKYVCRDWS